jgi:4-hydroxy-tetrahydrodipicolinate synthase
MKPDGAIDIDGARRLAAWLVDGGCDGLVISGTTGESPTTHAEEKAELVAAVVDAVGSRAVVLAGAGSNDTDHAIRMAEQAAEAGADGLLIVTPYYSRPSQEGLVRHISVVADAGGLPVMVYDVPSRTGVRISAGAYAQLATHPLVVAVKDATGDVGAAAGLAASTGLAWYSGDDSLFLPYLAHGGAGIVSTAANAVPSAFAAVKHAWEAGDAAAALAAFRRALPVITAINGGGMQAVMTKAAVEALGVISHRSVRLPLVEASADEAAAVRASLVAAGSL